MLSRRGQDLEGERGNHGEEKGQAWASHGKGCGFVKSSLYTDLLFIFGYLVKATPALTRGRWEYLTPHLAQTLSAEVPEMTMEWSHDDRHYN